MKASASSRTIATIDIDIGKNTSADTNLAWVPSSHEDLTTQDVY